MIHLIIYIKRDVYQQKITANCKSTYFQETLVDIINGKHFHFQRKILQSNSRMHHWRSKIALMKLEYLVVAPTNPNFYRRFVDYVITKGNLIEEDLPLKAMNSYHPKLEFSVEENPTKYLDTALEVHSSNVLTSVYRKPIKIPTHWSSMLPKRYKRNTIKGDLYRSNRISLDTILFFPH